MRKAMRKKFVLFIHKINDLSASVDPEDSYHKSNVSHPFLPVQAPRSTQGFYLDNPSPEVWRHVVVRKRKEDIEPFCRDGGDAHGKLIE